MTAQVIDTPTAQPMEASTDGEQPAYWSGVFAMTLCVFALIASEFMPVSLLTPMVKAWPAMALPSPARSRC
jgi:hypothetical protein